MSLETGAAVVAAASGVVTVVLIGYVQAVAWGRERPSLAADVQRETVAPINQAWPEPSMTELRLQIDVFNPSRAVLVLQHLEVVRPAGALLFDRNGTGAAWTPSVAVHTWVSPKEFRRALPQYLPGRSASDAPREPETRLTLYLRLPQRLEGAMPELLVRYRILGVWRQTQRTSRLTLSIPPL